MKFPLSGAKLTQQFAPVPQRILISRHYLKGLRSSSTEKYDPENPWAHVKPAEPPRRASMNDFPIPQGSWQDAYDKQQRKNNLILGAGVGLLAGSLFYAWYADPLHLEKVFGPYKYMKNPPAFESPVLEPNVLLQYAPVREEVAPEVVPVVKAEKVVPVEKVKQEAVVPVISIAQEKQPTVRAEKVYTPGSSGEPDKSKGIISHIDPEKIPDIPNHVPYLIIGGGTAAFSAFRSIRANNPKAAVLLVTEESHYPYMRPPLSKELWFSDATLSKNLRFKQWTGKERGIFFEHEEFYVDPKMLPYTDNGGVSVLRNTKVIRLDPLEQKVYLNNGWEIYYDRCLLATGAKPRSLPVLENAGKGVMKNVTLYRGIDDFRKLDEALKKAKNVLVIGGGFLGSELACALARRGKTNGMQVHQVYPEKGNLGRILPEYLSDWTTQKLQKVDGVKMYTEKYVKNARSSSNGQVVIQLNDDQEIEADHVVVAVGVSPNVELAASSGLEVDDLIGGYRVNAELEARSNIWVAGDAASFFDVTLGRRRLEHHDHAIATGRHAGENMVGKGKPFWHQSMFWSDLGPEIGFEAVGLIDASLETVAVFAKPDSSLQHQQEASKQVKNDAPIKSVPETPVYAQLRTPDSVEDYGKGIVFYLKDKVIVGILLWNVFNHISTSRKVIKDQKSFADLSELSKLFNLYDVDKLPEGKETAAD